MVRVLRNIGKRSRAKSYQSVSLLSVVSKIFQKHLINGHANHLDKSVFSFNCRSPTAVSDRIYRAFNRSWTTRAVAFDIFEAFDRVLHIAILHHKLKSYGISSYLFVLISSFLGNRQFQVVPDVNLRKSILSMLTFLSFHFWSYAFPIVF